ncbi:MAG TPA: hypothetical protein VJV23_16135 [Candidatus Polarisedimenticolia bacterium]|nr:hypothetical protein [Candidatus Polarisedimenticolia bacterium]
MRRRDIAWGLVVLVLAAGAAAASTVVGLSIEDQARLSKVVVVGEVVGQRGVHHEVNGLETAVTLRITDVLKGDARRGQAITFHTRGGEMDGEVSEAVGEATFRKGQRALVFIEEVEGRLYNLGLSMGAWDVHEDARGAQHFTRAVRDDLTIVGGEVVEHGPLTYEEMRSRVAYAARNPRFDNEMLNARIGQGRK